ncbi:MAG: transcription antitermination factor NusB [Selenomonadaceae bacterium]|nr:transcription antitermination factor NusB [Selenomonadaceae bacterium]
MSRKLAREAAFKALFQLDFNFNEEAQDDSENLAIQTMFDEEPKLTSKKDFSYIDSTVKGTRARLEEIDALITANLKEGWQLPRLMAADRNILRLAVYEMKFSEPTISKGIVINEAVELAKRYGTDDSSRFVNGILVAISN